MMPRAGYTGSTRGENGNAPPKAYFVPWKVLTAEEPPISAPIVLYWFPASVGEMQGGDLVTSRMLILFSAQCVGMQLVRPDDTATIDKWGVAAKLPTALLVSDGKAVAHVDSKDGLLTLSDVENMVHHELWARETALEADLAAAKQKADAGDRDGAIALYRKVWDQRCIAPPKGREAQKALGRLGIRLADDTLRATDPVITPEMNRRMTAAMDRAFAAELAGNYARARTLYLAASKIDPADPVPPRFLGELYRHQTGEWTLAQATFERLLTMQPDLLSRAVALHGLGKMTIHMGDSAKGLELFHESIAAYPLALTYRNLAVYWNSERQRDKADVYVRKALALDPDDPYNLVFAATYMADSGRQQEALRIARKNEHLLSASYNLAAIYALLGNKSKAMELLKRHFYQYERYDDVRAMEMWEARVDYVFASIKDDPDFVKLTAMAR
jgi:tetratricopeptide (TPR) repeat protein